VTNPANVPAPEARIHLMWDRQPATHPQMNWLAILSSNEGVELADLYGEGYRSMGHLSKYAAHWGIEILESRQAARAYEQAEQQRQEDAEQLHKSLMAHLLRMKNPNGEWSRNA
jgi:hypothetical protein